MAAFEGYVESIVLEAVEEKKRVGLSGPLRLLGNFRA